MNWDQAAIGAWADRTFGSAKSAAVIAARANVEMAELVRWLAKDPAGMGVQTAEETADVAIVLFRLAHHCRFDLLAEVAKKMDINLRRRWEKESGGCGRHIRVDNGAATLTDQEMEPIHLTADISV